MMIVVYTCYSDALRHNAGHAMAEQIARVRLGALSRVIAMFFCELSLRAYQIYRQKKISFFFFFFLN